MPIKPAPVWVTRHEEGWKVKREGAQRASVITRKQEEAFEIGGNIARREHTEVYLTGRNGQIRLRNSFGHDPASRKN